MTAPRASGGGPPGSRLARMIARLTMQRDCLEWAAAEIAHVPGAVLEVGLGKGRTFDHLRRLLPARAIYAFDRFVHAPADCVPDAAHLRLGDFRDTLPAARSSLPPAALIHADIGSDDRDKDAALVAFLGPVLAVLLAPGGLVLTDRALAAPGLEPVALPVAGGDWPYYAYRRRAAR